MNKIINEVYFNTIITKEQHKKNIVEVLSTFFLAKDKIKYLISNNCCYLNGNLMSDKEIVKIGDYLTIDISKYEKLDYLPDEFPIDILYEDDYLLIVNKPAGYIIYPDTNSGHNTIVNFIANYYLSKKLNITVRHCHRLDKDTSGCLIFAKDVITHSAMCKMFEEKKINKTYWAYVEGIIEKGGIINLPIGKDRHINGKMIVAKGGKLSKTYYKPLSFKKNKTLLEVKIDSGRTHQIRVHLATIGHPLVGDSIYGGKKSSRVMLHCKTLSFIHPITNKKIYIEANITNDFRKLD